VICVCIQYSQHLMYIRGTCDDALYKLMFYLLTYYYAAAKFGAIIGDGKRKYGSFYGEQALSVSG